MRELDVIDLSETLAPSKGFTGVVDVSVPLSGDTGVDSDEEVFTELEPLDLNEEDAFVLFGALSKTWSIDRNQKREQRKDRQLPDRLTMTEEISEPRRKSKILIARLKAISRCANCGKR